MTIWKFPLTCAAKAAKTLKTGQSRPKTTPVSNEDQMHSLKTLSAAVFLGLSALTLVDMAFLRAGDQVLLPDNAYGPGKAFALKELAQWGISHAFYDPLNPADLAARIGPATRLVWIEAPGSITMEFPDVPALVAVVRAANAGRERPVVTALDNTWGAGIAFQPFDQGVDVSIQALTKYPSGGADVLMGSVITRDSDLHRQILLTRMRLGIGVGANDVELVLRGLPSMALRYHAQDASTRELAAWMQQQPGVAQVLHPALPDSPGHAAWKRDATAAACLFSVVFDAAIPQARVDAFCDSLRLFRLGWSWAGPVSLCAPYKLSSIRSQGWSDAGALVRFAIGLESVDDLRADLAELGLAAEPRLDLEARIPVAWLLRHTAFYRWVVVAGGSLTIAVIGSIWLVERLGG